LWPPLSALAPPPPCGVRAGGPDSRGRDSWLGAGRDSRADGARASPPDGRSYIVRARGCGAIIGGDCAGDWLGGG